MVTKKHTEQKGPLQGRMTAAVLIFALIFCFSSATVAQEGGSAASEQAQEPGVVRTNMPTPFVDRFMKSQDPIRLEAASVSYDNRTESYRAEGGVVVRQGDIRLKTSSVYIDLKNKTLAADGPVTLENDEGRMTCDALYLDFDQETGIIVQGRLVVYQNEHNYYITGERIEKIGPSRFRIENGTYSTCDCEQADEADWLIQAREIDLTLDGYAIVRHARFYSFDNPVAWVPYGVFPAIISRKTGFLSPRMGWASDDGYHVGIPFFWAIADFTDMTIDSDWYENRGVKEGMEWRYAMSQRWKGQFDLDMMPEDRLFGRERWAVAYEHQQNVWRRLFIRSKINHVSDNDYVVDFPGDIKARYDSFLRSNVIVNNLWEDFDLNVDLEYYDDLSQPDNAFTWQRLPEASFDGVFSPFVGPLGYSFDVTATKFSRQRIREEERELDRLAGHTNPYTYLTDGHRVEVTPQLLAPLSFRRYAFLTPFVGGEGTFYQLNDRHSDRSPTRVLHFSGADLHTEMERVFSPVHPVIRGVKHAIQPGVSYLYFPDAHPQDKLPIFDGRDRRRTQNRITYYLENRLWLKWLSLPRKRFSTLKLLDLRFSQDYDFHEAERKLIEQVETDELRPLSPVRGELEVFGKTTGYLNKILLRSEADYNLYDDRIGRFNALGTLGSIHDDTIGAEYRYHIQDNSDVVDIDFLSGFFQYTLVEFITFGAIGRYSFLDDTFVERIYSVRLNSLQNCWTLELRTEQRELPEKETSVHLVLDLTGLINAKTSF